jgi:hypothetical protein
MQLLVHELGSTLLDAADEQRRNGGQARREAAARQSSASTHTCNVLFGDND